MDEVWIDDRVEKFSVMLKFVFDVSDCMILDPDEKIMGKFLCDMMIDDEYSMDDCVNVSDEMILDIYTDGFEGFPNEHVDEFYPTFSGFVVNFVKDIKYMIEEEKMIMEPMENIKVSFLELATKDEKKDGLLLRMLTVAIHNTRHKQMMTDDKKN